MPEPARADVSMRNPSIHKVLVANRGEIARRIFRTLREVGISTVAVFSDADRDAPHTREADEAVRVGPAPSADSYLDIDGILGAAKAVGADAVHPGYGFLAENADFAERCGGAGLVFIGPSPSAIRTMGDKGAAKELAREAGVPVLDGFQVGDLEPEEVRRRADALGYPLLIKAAAGGGGKGMRRVQGPEGLESALSGASREAESAFGDGSLLVERWLGAPRHVEVQVVGDAHGGLLHLFERDCSVQRRYQQVFEEAPSPAVGPDLRRRMGRAAVDLARAAGYVGVGTVEFLVDRDAFFFLEMNTRLQVEHPVTEAVTGLDLVAIQVAVARGLPLQLGRADLHLEGHAVEARLYAEDPEQDFLPATGTVDLWSVPDLPGLRVDSGVEEGSRIGIHYDPMLAKVVAHGRNRAEALDLLRRGLSDLAVGGVVTNRDFLLAVLDDDAFRRGEVDTSFVDRHLPPERRRRAAPPEVLERHAIACTVFLFAERQGDPWPTPPGLPPAWRNNRWRPQGETIEHRDLRFEVSYLPQGDGSLRVGVAGAAPETEVRFAPVDGHGLWSIEIAGVRRRYRIARGSEDGRLWIHGSGTVTDWHPIPRFPERTEARSAGGCAAPMTGRVLEVLVEVGDTVEAGAAMVVLEAMKMEHRLEAPTGGMVQEVRVTAGQMVDPDDVLVIVEPVDEGGGGAAA
ncbi:MAG: biotin carboxylase N-terminal domain-containing protein [Acidobacteriota bacterium]